ncbi:unnamed protein product [Urochloa humidicola]
MSSPGAQGQMAGGRRQEADLTAQLPDDVLAYILRRLPHRSLGFSRCVCRAWRAVVDARRLLRTAELLPRAPAGIFINYHCYESLTELFSSPSSPATGPPVSGRRRYLPDPERDGKSWGHVRDHCNGLLLVDGNVTDDYHCPLQYVLNPATRWAAPLPLRRPPHVEVNSREDRYLVYDPAASPHYQWFQSPASSANASLGTFSMTGQSTDWILWLRDPKMAAICVRLTCVLVEDREMGGEDISSTR